MCCNDSREQGIIIQLELLIAGVLYSLIPRPSRAPVFDRLQYAKTEPAGFINWSWGRPGNEASSIHVSLASNALLISKLDVNVSIALQLSPPPTSVHRCCACSSSQRSEGAQGSHER